MTVGKIVFKSHAKALGLPRQDYGQIEK